MSAGCRGGHTARAAGERGTEPHTSSKAWMANVVSQICDPLVPCGERITLQLPLLHSTPTSWISQAPRGSEGAGASTRS